MTKVFFFFSNQKKTSLILCYQTEICVNANASFVNHVAPCIKMAHYGFKRFPCIRCKQPREDPKMCNNVNNNRRDDALRKWLRLLKQKWLQPSGTVNDLVLLLDSRRLLDFVHSCISVLEKEDEGSSSSTLKEDQVATFMSNL